MDNTYIVREGDTLSEIIKNQAGNVDYDTLMQIANDNNIDNPDKIYVGQEINLSSINTNNDRNIEIKTSSSTSSSTNTTSTSTSSSTSNEEIVLNKSDEQEMLEKLNLDKTLEDKKIQEKTVDDSPNNEEIVKDATKTIEAGVSAATSVITSVASASQIKSAPVSTSTFTPSLYEVCFPESVKGFEVIESFRRFVIKENAGEKFVAVNQRIDKCSEDINQIISALQSLKQDMGENTGTTEQIDKIVKGLTEKQMDLKNKMKELITACNEVVQYVYDNKASKSEEASKVAATIARIKI